MAELDKEKLKKLIRLLSSDKDGEVLAAVAAIERQLKWANLSFHELADMLSDRIIQAYRIRIVEVDRTQKDWIEACDKLLETGKLNERESTFVEDIKRMFQLKPGFEASAKQTNWFVSLYRTHVGDKVNKNETQDSPGGGGLGRT